jgi:hypothetical protein
MTTIAATPFARLAESWKAFRQERADRSIDRYFARERTARERFLAHASDHFELERLERDWDRRQSAAWRVY